MTQVFFEAAISNAIIAVPLALIAAMISWKCQQPKLAYWLWLLVLIKLVTPPIFTVPVSFFDAAAELTEFNEPLVSAAASMEVESQHGHELESENQTAVVGSSMDWQMLQSGAIWIWCIGTCVLLVITLMRVIRFDRLVHGFSRSAPDRVQEVAEEIAARLSLTSVPKILTTDAQVSPMVWWAGSGVKVIIPSSLLKTLKENQWRLVLAHELSHVKRRDHLVRWLECLAGTCFWWNPVMRWARNQLRAAEEICCDMLVLSELKADPLEYANSLFVSVESLVCPAYRPPAVASEINSGGRLERRFEMLVSDSMKRPVTRVSWLLVLVLALLALPLGMASAQDYEKVEKKLRKSVQKGHITQQQAEAMMEALHRTSKKGERQSNEWTFKVERTRDGFRDNDAMDRRVQEATRRIKEAMEKGELTEGEGREKMEALRRRVAEAMKKRSDEKRSDEIRWRVKQNNERKDSDSANLRDRAMKAMEKSAYNIEVAIKEGEISKEEGRRKMAELREGFERRLKRIEKMKQGDVLREREMALAARLAELERQQQANRKEVAEAMRRKQEYANVEAEMEKITAKMKKAVEGGKMTAEEAEKKLDAVRDKMRNKLKSKMKLKRSDSFKASGEDRPKNFDRKQFREIQMKIKEAVANGDLTKEEANKKVQQLRKEIAKQRGDVQKKDSRKDKDKQQKARDKKKKSDR